MVEWGLVHVLGMILDGMYGIVNKTKPAYVGTYGKVLGPDAKDPRSAKLNELYDAFYANPLPPYYSRIIVQHAWNLGWAGVAALVAPAFIASPLWCRFTFVWCLIPYLLDVGYWLAVDVPGLGGAAAEAQTYIVSVGMGCIGHGINERFKDAGPNAPGDAEKYLMYIVPGLLFMLGLITKAGHAFGLHPFGFLIREDLSALE